MKKLLLILLCLPLIFSCGSSNDNNNDTKEQEINNETFVELEVLNSSPEKIRTAFFENEFSANQTYLNKIIKMEDCEVEDIKQGDGSEFPSTDVYLKIKLEDLNGYSDYVYCFLSEDEISKATNLKKGKKVKIKGNLTKLWRGGGDTFVMHLKNCTVKLSK